LNNPLRYIDPSGRGPLEDLLSEQAKRNSGEEVDTEKLADAFEEIAAGPDAIIERPKMPGSEINSFTEWPKNPEPTTPPKMALTEVTKNDQQQSSDKASTLENVGSFIVGILILEVGSVWSAAGVLALEVPPLAAGCEIVGVAHYYSGTICITNAIQGKGFPTWSDFAAPFKEAWEEAKNFWHTINPFD